MGVTINETIRLSNGLTVTNPYTSVGENDIRIEKRLDENHDYDSETTTVTTRYVINCRFTMWVTHALRTSGARDIGGIGVEVVSETPPTGNVYGLLYAKLKSERDCTDVL